MPVDSTCMKSKKRQQIGKALFEVLEDRRMMSATVSFADGVLNLSGNQSNTNSIKVKLIDDGQVRASINGTRKTVALSSVRKIRITGGDLADIISVDPNVKVRTAIRAGGGNDRVYGGGGKDDIKGGIGNDALDGRGGDDLITGERGNDTMVGGAGDDTMYGGAGNDVRAARMPMPRTSNNNPTPTGSNGNPTPASFLRAATIRRVRLRLPTIPAPRLSPARVPATRRRSSAR